MGKIKKLSAREILDSRGNPTVEVDLTLEGGAFGRASVPSGASTGKYEAIELRDHDAKRYGGMGVLKAVANVEGRISARVCGGEFNQKTLDETLIELDGTHNKASLGANAILGVSLAFARAEAVRLNLPLYEYISEIFGHEMFKETFHVLLPVPYMNVINGGAHAAGSTDIQEFMIVPHGLSTFHDALRAGVEIFHTLKKVLETEGLNTNVGDEGGYAPAVGGNMKAVELIVRAIEMAGYTPKKDIGIALDIAASELWTSDGHYELPIAKKKMTTKEMINWYEEIISKYPLISLEDPLAEDDWAGYQELMKRIGDKIQIVGDDLYATNKTRLAHGVAERSTNAILIKPNQIGTLTETLETIKFAKTNGFKTMVSHRSGETEDSFIADLAVGAQAGKIKAGPASRGERLTKYNQLLRIEETTGTRARFGV